jgi:hypothetical protein
MGARLADADGRTFFDEYESVRISRFRALGIVDPAKNQAVIPMGGKEKLIGVSHMRFPSGGGWSFFQCPQCAKRSMRLYLVNDQPLCCRCCSQLNIRHARSYGFGRAARLQASDKTLDKLISKVEATERLRLKPHPPSWGGRAQIVVGSHRKTELMRRRMIALRLNQLANQQERSRAAKDDALVTMRPAPEARQLMDLSAIWKANTNETLARALDHATVLILNALESNDPQTRLNAAKLMMRTKQARDRGL